MNQQNGHVDGDDYTWGADSQAGAVLKPGAAAAFAELREKFGAHFDAIEDVDAWVKAQRRGFAPLELPEHLATDGWQLHQAAGPDLRTERTELALNQRMDSIVEMLTTHRAEMAGLRSWVMGVLEWREIVEQRVGGDRGLEARVRDLEKTLALVELILRISANPKTPDRLEEIEGVIRKMTNVLERITELLKGS